MWKLFMRLMDKAGGDGGAGGGAGSGGAGDGKGGAPGGDGKGGTLLSGGGSGSGLGADGKPIAGAGGAGESKPWNWAEGIPGTGAAPAWYKADKYKSVDAQAQAAIELETKLGPAGEYFGAPPDGKYVLPKLPDELGGEFNAEDPLLKSFIEFAGKKGLSQKAFDENLLFYAQVQAGQHEQSELALADALTKMGPNAAARIDAIEQYVTATLGAEGFKALDSAIGTNVQAMQALEKLVALQANDPRLANPGAGSGGTGAMTKADISAKQFEKYPEGHALAGKVKYEHDAAWRAEVDGLWIKHFPGQDQQAVG